jgi:flagellin-specific chaperone FliS
MHQTAYRNQQEYRQQDVMGASPMRLIVMAYDLAIVACEQKNFEKAAKTISVLRDALNFDYPEVAVGLLRLYQWCLDCLRKGDYVSAMNTLKELRNAWQESEELVVDPANGVFTSTSVPSYAGVGRFA